MPDFSVGDKVGYVLHVGRSIGEVRPAFIVKVWDTDNGCSNLQVLTDGQNDGLPAIHWATSILYDADKKPGTWHSLELD